MLAKFFIVLAMLGALTLQVYSQPAEGVEAPKQTLQDAPQETPKEVPKEAPQEAPKEAPQETTKEASQEASLQAPKDNPKEASQEAPKNNSTSNDVSDKASQNTQKEPKDAPQQPKEQPKEDEKQTPIEAVAENQSSQNQNPPASSIANETSKAGNDTQQVEKSSEPATTKQEVPKKGKNNDTTSSEDISQHQEVGKKSSNSSEVAGGTGDQDEDIYYTEDYDFFDGIFENDYDYEDYFSFEDLYGYGGDDNEYYNDFENFFYDGLYEDNYYYEDDILYDVSEYQDYEYYGDYAYYGVYDEEGQLYDMNDMYDEYDEQIYDYFQFDEDLCDYNDKNQTVLNASMEICNVTLEGADKHVKNLQGGLDGVYILAGCLNGRPKYVRYEPAGQERVLWWSSLFADWDISTGIEPNEEDILCYGGEGLDEERPNFVGSWSVAADIITDKKDEMFAKEDYFMIDLSVKCASGEDLVRPERSSIGKQPLLTDNEMESQYRMIYERYARKQPPSPSINFTLVVIMVFVGMGVVLGIPYMMVKRGPKSKGAQQQFVSTRRKQFGKE